MKTRWKSYLLYASLIIIGGSLFFILEETIRLENTGFGTKTLWDWMELLVIPLVLAIGAFYLNRSERAVERLAAEDRAKLEREIANDRQQEEALQAYLDRMADLLLKEKLRTSDKFAEVRDVARIRTLAVLRRLDPNRKRLLLLFLQEAGLIKRGEEIIVMPDCDLNDVDLHMCVLEDIDLNGANLSRANLEMSILVEVDLSGANLSFANLKYTHMRAVSLYGANLSGADLSGANLRNSTLSSAKLHASNLQDANLGETTLYNANLQYANLRGAKVSEDQLASAESLKGATMPDGTKHE